MCDFGFAGPSTGQSPDRLDALVYAATGLVAPQRPEPRIVSLDTPPKGALKASPRPGFRVRPPSR